MMPRGYGITHVQQDIHAPVAWGAGKIERGFDFLGYRFGSRVLELAEATIERFLGPSSFLFRDETRPAGAERVRSDYQIRTDQAVLCLNAAWR